MVVTGGAGSAVATLTAGGTAGRVDTSSVQACYKSPPDTTLLNPARFCNQRNTNSKPLHTSDVGISQNNENDFILIFTSNFAVK